mmetsp:Transcript_19053/g.26606  ORF Transcript_19053/g.26606 Transcript_19053/m.26606 type:complete len:102 (-) Transcript_19053:995-1300(-)
MSIVGSLYLFLGNLMQGTHSMQQGATSPRKTNLADLIFFYLLILRGSDFPAIEQRVNISESYSPQRHVMESINKSASPMIAESIREISIRVAWEDLEADFL